MSKAVNWIVDFTIGVVLGLYMAVCIVPWLIKEHYKNGGTK